MPTARLIQRTAVATASLALAVGGLTATASTAHAAPTGCTSGTNSFGFVWAKCTSGTGQFRVKSGCWGYPFGLYEEVQGGWTRVGGTSIGFCFGQPTNSSAETRD